MSTQLSLANNRLSQSVDRHEAAVVGLFFCGRPAAVSGFVAHAVVDAIKLMARSWFPAQLGKEDGIIVPNGRKFNSTSAVAFPVFVVRIATAVAGSRPRFIFWSVIALAVAGVGTTDSRVFVAPARFGAAGFQVVGLNDMVIAAIAAAEPVGVAAFRMRQRDDRQKVEFLACEVFEARAVSRCGFPTEASAGFDGPHFELTGGNDLLVSAIASTQPSDYVVRADIVNRDCGQAAKSLIGQIAPAKFLHGKAVSQAVGFV